MTFSTIQKKMETFLPFWLAFLFFLAQLSTSLKSIPLVIAVVFILCLPDTKRQLVQILKTSWCQALLFLFGVVCVASFWGPATTAKKLSVIKQYDKLLYLPILVIGLSNVQNRQWALMGFLGGMLCTVFWGMILQSQDNHYDHVFFNYIMTGFSMSFAACLCLFYAFNTKGRTQKLYLVLFTLFSLYVFFVNLGRSGYVMYALMLGLLLILSLPWRQSLLGLCLLAAFLFGAFAVSPTLQTRITTAVSDYLGYDNNKNTSVGYRIQFHDYAWDLLKRHPLLGNGAASFPTLFYEENPVPAFGREINEPHSMYWLVASEFGVLGLVGLLWFFGSLFCAAWTLGALRIPCVILMSSFMVVNFTDSLLFYSASGYLFVLFSAYCLGETLLSASKKSSVSTSASIDTRVIA